MRAVSVRLAAAVVAASLAACAANAPPRFHSLLASALTSRQAGAVPAPAGPPAIVVGPVNIPADVDQPQWLVRLPDDSLALLESERWAAPLRDELRQAVIDGLVSRYGAFEYRTGGSNAPPWRIAIDVRRFESIPGLEARIEGVWRLSSDARGSPAIFCEWVIREPVGNGMLELAAGHRRSVMRLTDSIGTQLLRLQAGQRINCTDAPGPA